MPLLQEKPGRKKSGTKRGALQAGGDGEVRQAGGSDHAKYRWPASESGQSECAGRQATSGVICPQVWKNPHLGTNHPRGRFRDWKAKHEYRQVSLDDRRISKKDQ